MTHEETDPRAERLRAVVLARLLPRTKRPPTRSEVVLSVSQCLHGATSEDDVRHALSVAIEQGLVVKTPLGLSERGRETLRAALAVETLPQPKDWRAVQRTLLLTLALGVKSAKGGDTLAAAILTREHELPQGTTLKRAVDRLCWRALGVDRDTAFEVTRVQRYLLRDVVPEDARVNAITFRRLLAVRAVGAKRSDADSLRKAAVLRWARGTSVRVQRPDARVAGDEGSTASVSRQERPAASVSQQERPAASVPPQERPAASVPPQESSAANVPQARSDNDNAPPSLGDLANAVVRAAREPAVARFHDDRAFIGSIWEHMRGRAPVGSMSLDEFKAQLVAAHRAGLLRMTRADLVGALDPSELARSEATHLGSTFHFVALDAAGGR